MRSPSYFSGQALNGLIYAPDNLVGAAHERQYAVARMLVMQGADVNAPTEDGTPPLAYAARKGDARMIALLHSRGRS